MSQKRGFFSRAEDAVASHGLFEKLIGWSFVALTFVLPLFFFPTTFEVLQFQKHSLLVVVAIVMTVLWFGRMFSEKNFSYKKSPLNIALAVFVVLYGLSSVFSLMPAMSFGSIAGADGASFLTVISLALIFFVGVNALESTYITRVVWALLFSGFIAAAYGIFQMFGVFLLPFDFTKANAFNTIGTLNAFALFLLPVFVLSVLLFFHAQGAGATKWKKIFLAVLSILSFCVFMALDYWVIWTGVLIACGCVFVFGTAKTSETNAKWLMAPMAAIALALLFLFIQSPFTGKTSLEVTPSHKASWEIAKQVFGERMLLGSGPGMYALDYAKYHDANVNATAFWSVRFNQASSTFMTVLANTGVLGALAWLVFMGFSAWILVKGVVKSDFNENGVLYLGVVSGWLALLVMKFLYTNTVTLDFLSFLLLALGAGMALQESRRISLEKSYKGSLVVSFAFILFIVAAFGTVYCVAQKYRGEMHFKDYLIVRNEDGGMERGIVSLAKAVQVNPKQDGYYRAIAQTQRQRILELSSQEKLSDEQVEVVRGLVSSGLDAARRATELAPADPGNWATLAAFYNTITPFTQGAGDLAVEAYKKSIELDPTNPQLLTDFGLHYLSIRDFVLRNVPKDDKEKAKVAQEQADALADMASEQFAKAMELKKDYVPAYYHNATLLVAKGDKSQALSQMELGKFYQPRNVDVSFRLGLLYYDNGEKDKAIAELERTIGLFPNHLNARWFLASMYEEMGETTKAVEHLQKILEANPELDVVKEKLDKLTSPKKANPEIILDESEEDSE